MPEEYCLKKSTGSISRRDTVAAATATPLLVSRRLSNSILLTPIIAMEIVTPTSSSASDASAFMSLL